MPLDGFELGARLLEAGEDVFLAHEFVTDLPGASISNFVGVALEDEILDRAGP